MNKDYAKQEFLDEWQDKYGFKDVVFGFIVGILLGILIIVLAHILLTFQLY